MKKFLVLLCSLAMMLALVGCGGGEKKAETPKTDAPKVLRVGTEPTFAPFEFQKEGSSEFTGFDMDLIRAIGQQLNMKVEIQNLGFDGLIPAVNAGNIDLAISAMTITPDRQKVVEFSEPYYTSGLIIVVNKTDDSIKSIADLENKRIAVQIGTTGAAKAETVKGAKVTNFNTGSELFMELKNKGADAVIVDSPVAGYYLAQGGSETAKTVGDVMEAESYGMITKKGNTQLMDQVNKALNDLKKNGVYDKIYQQWFGETAKK